ncbi:MAG: YibE/F family protein, partial [Patescibacteria group bacterium]
MVVTTVVTTSHAVGAVRKSRTATGASHAILQKPSSNAVTGTASTIPAADALLIDTERSPNNESEGNHSLDGTYERAIVLSVARTTATTTHGAQQLQSYEIQFLSGPFTKKTRTISSDIATNPYHLDPRTGDTVLIFLQPNPAGTEPLMFLEGFDRRAAVYWLLALWIFTMVLLAGWQGLKITFSILLSILLIGWIVIPSFLHGVNPVPIALGLTVLLTGISAIFTVGWNKKSFVTIVGTLGGALVAYAIASLFSGPMHLSGLASDEDRLFFDKNPLLNPQGLLFAGIIIASMGVVEDVAVSIASGVMEVRRANPRLRFKNLFHSGMVVGRDHMGALANTLVFAYVGASLSTLLLYSQHGGSWAKFINFDIVINEIIRSLAGTIGLVFTVPITALLAAWIACRATSRK